MTDVNPLSRDELHAQVQHRLIEELGSTERRLRRLLEILPEVAFQCDENERVTYLNEAWHTLLGHEISDSIGEPLSSFLLDEDRDSWPKFPRPGEADREVQLRFRAKEGEARWFLVMLRTTAEGEHTGLLHDVTDRIELESQLRQAQKMEAVGQLASGIAHEINTPSQYVNDNVLFLKDAVNELLAAVYGEGEPPDAKELEFLKENAPESVEQALQGMDRIATIVKSMKNFAYRDAASEKRSQNLNQAIEATTVVATSLVHALGIVVGAVEKEFTSRVGFVVDQPIGGPLDKR